ncbi:dihydroorotase [Rhodonellum sp.]|uniref:dihydroorotase n=1 Tax=Rhodonellum sp. TaxID=2231180 RepID=UPI00271C9879|nr:dihydroorotase [Rhodonellum sp.]MDO9553787.1 dihydroorotase [Rhodonellum sp.]
MAILFKSLRLIDAETIHPPKDYMYNGEQIQVLNPKIDKEFDEEFDCADLLASKGWIDLRCMCGEPGLEFKESIESLGAVLQESGFCKGVLMPNTEPSIQSKNEVQFLKNRSQNLFSDFLIQGAATKNNEGEDFTEILDLHNEGVTIFGDGIKPLSNPDRLLKVLQYLQKFDGTLFDQSYDPLIALFGHVHEGTTSTIIGVKGIPSLSEELAVRRNVEILRYTGGRMHFQTISTKGAVDIIREAKKDGLNVTADISIFQLMFSDEDLIDFDTNLKVMPPFRSKSDREALIGGLKDGTIDAIVSNHQPQDKDSKHMEFDLASFGMIGLQTFLPAMVKLSLELTWPLLIQKITSGPELVLRSKETKFNTLTVFDPGLDWVYNLSSNKSNSSNSPWFDQKLTGKVKYVVNGAKFVKIHE